MQRNVYKTVDEYLKAVPQKERALLQKLRATIRKAAPKAEEVISYRIPGYKYHGHLIFFALQKDFCSLYGTSRALLKKFQKSYRILRYQEQASTLLLTILCRFP